LAWKLGIDVGGTFTDFLVTGSDGRSSIFKQLSTPEDPSLGVVAGLGRIAESLGMPLAGLVADIETIVHGTTVTTNATLTGNGARCGLITTAGLRDALEMRRGIREEQYNNRYTNVTPLVPRYRRLGVRGRIDRDGNEVEPLDDAAVAGACDTLERDGIEAVALCFMNAFANPGHERQAAAIIRHRLPDVYLSVSSDVLPAIRFYDRLSTTVLNAYVGPKLKRYLDRLTQRLEDLGFAGTLLIMQSNGGVMTPDVAREKAALTLLSGPAAGPAAGLAYVRPHGRPRCLTVDMGGTSFDAAVVDGAPLMVTEGAINRHRIALPMLGIHTIGAGGGSIGWLDAGGLIRMGPESAGADPGPACYGKGGTRPTTTDANLVLGYLDAAYFAGGRMTLDMAAARTAIDTHIARPLGMTVEEAAAGMYRIACTGMAQGVREITIRRGLDPREFPLLVAGGAGPVHSSLIAGELDIPLQIVPRESSILCAAGMLMGDLRHDFVRTFVCRLDTVDWPGLEALIAEMHNEGAALLAAENIAAARCRFDLSFDCRYENQYHEVSFPVARERVGKNDGTAIADAFHEAHMRLFGYHLRDEQSPVEIINIRLTATGTTDKPALEKHPARGPAASHAIKGERPVYIPARDDFEAVAVYDGHALECGNRITGPAMIEQETTAIFVGENFDCVIDLLGSFVLIARGRDDLLSSGAWEAQS